MSQENTPPPSTHDQIWTSVQVAENSENFDIAEEILSKAIRQRISPEHTALYLGELALINLARKRYDKVLDICGSLLGGDSEIEARHPNLHFNLLACLEIATFLQAGGDVAEVPFHGHTLRFAISGQNSELEFQHIRQKLYEPEEVELILKHMGEEDIVLDLGANVGNHAIALATARPNATIHVFEPIKKTCELLRRNIALNGLTNIDASNLDIAVDSEDGFLNMVQRINLASSREANEGIGPAIPKRALRSLWPERVDFIKMDVEGAELRIIKSVLDLIRRDRTKIILECYKTTVEQDFADLAELGLEQIDCIERSAVFNVLVQPK
ncbi:FkbM family methyltransferase [Nisaea nitritireducens]|uniref:FkbM family methyltransferase n=1 Tax=Nisaea nitritireducens TaxID=568392 RepID=UPI0018684CF3|nr:FkbM family methyltransferase [Nisaea nitritireducens]